ncbi:MAG: Methylcrotonoyl-CoA carboxylase beta chain, partial [Actinomycetota bacterium]
MPVLPDRIDERSEAYRTNRAALQGLLQQHDELLAQVLGGGGPQYVERHRKRGKLLARERIELLVDADSPFLELSPLAAWGTSFPTGASLVTGIGVVEGRECVIIANDPTT